MPRPGSAPAWALLTTQDGNRVVTNHGWPLYTYLGDARPGRAAGQGDDDDG